jgi:hypothetical protein
MEKMDQDQKAGCVISLIGCAITVIALGMGAYSWFGALCMETYEDIPGILVGTAVGGILGLVLFIIGGVKVGSGGKEESLREKEARPRGQKLCPNCGCRVANGSKNCRWCGADQD